ncbi:MAG TPA: NAD(P)-dependent oxidoreductase [Nitrospiraceae bacterium]|nr:NAD(P)-dependent oxidoreductase [Nitrospiraceae bacterium]
MILITGGTGFLGKRLVRKSLELGHKRVRCLVRPGTPRDIFRSLQAEFPSVQLEVFPASFNDSDALKKALQGVGIVYHAAASKKGAAPSLVANTVVGSEYLYKASVETGVSRFVLVSSFGVIGAASQRRGDIIDESIAMEEHPEWRDPYSFSKHQQEVLAWRYAKEHNLPLVVIRPGGIFGPGGEILHSRLGLNVFGIFLDLGSSNVMPLTYVDNCAEAIILAGTVPSIGKEVFCIVDDELPMGKDLIRRYRTEVKALKTIRIPYWLLKPLSYCNIWYTRRTKGHIPAVVSPYEVETMWKGHRFNNAKAKQLLGWTPKISMRDALDATFVFLAKAEKANQRS